MMDLGLFEIKHGFYKGYILRFWASIPKCQTHQGSDISALFKICMNLKQEKITQFSKLSKQCNYLVDWCLSHLQYLSSMISEETFAFFHLPIKKLLCVISDIDSIPLICYTLLEIAFSEISGGIYFTVLI